MGRAQERRADSQDDLKHPATKNSERPSDALFFMLKIRRTTKGGGLKALEQQAKEAHGLVSDVGVTSKSNSVLPKKSEKDKPLTMAQLAQILERGWVQRISAKQVGFFRHNFGITLKRNNTLTLPPRPFLNLTAQKKMKQWVRIYINAVKGGYVPIKALSMASQTAVEDVRETIDNGGVGGTRFKKRSPMTMELYRQKTQGIKVEEDAGYGTTTPLKAKGALRNSMAYLIHKRLGL